MIGKGAFYNLLKPKANRSSIFLVSVSWSIVKVPKGSHCISGSFGRPSDHPLGQGLRHPNIHGSVSDLPYLWAIGCSGRFEATAMALPRMEPIAGNLRFWLLALKDLWPCPKANRPEMTFRRFSRMASYLVKNPNAQHVFSGSFGQGSWATLFSNASWAAFLQRRADGLRICHVLFVCLFGLVGCFCLFIMFSSVWAFHVST